MIKTSTRKILGYLVEECSKLGGGESIRNVNDNDNDLVQIQRRFTKN